MNPLLAAASITASMPGRVLSTYLQVHAPLRLVGDDWSSPLGWSPSWFRPYAHQAAAFERLTTSKSFAQPTLLVADKGAGATEAYLYPILDHCLRQKRSSRPGMKALVVCSTAGVAREHARRAAAVIGWDAALDGVTIGCHPGIAGRGGAQIVVGAVSVPVDPTELGASPPDVVFTTSTALGSLMVDPGFEGLWKTTTRESLRYVVVEDIQGYGRRELGELALGLRRIGAKLHMQTGSGGPPLGGATVVGTICAPPAGADQLEHAADLGSRLFGVELGLDSVVVESRHTAAELASVVDRSARVPTPVELAAVDPGDLAGVAAALGLAELAGDPVALGSRLGLHPLVAAVMTAASERPIAVSAVLDGIGQWAPSWQFDPADEAARAAATAALARLLGLFGIARRRVGSADVALVAVDVHQWVVGDAPLAVVAELLPAVWSSGPADRAARRALVLTGSLQDASHGAALLRRAVPPAAAGAEAPAVIARDATSATPPEVRAAVDGAFDAAHPEAPLVLLTPRGPDVGVDEGTVSTLVLLGAPGDAADYRRRIGSLGRDGGSSLAITVVDAGGRDRALAADADSVVAGPLQLPDCVVDDVQLLRRYYLAEAADELLSSGRRSLSASVTVEQAVRDGFDPEAALGALVKAASDPERSSSFVGSLGIGGLGSPSPVTPTDLAAGAGPGTLFGRPIAEGSGAGSIARPDPSSSPTSAPTSGPPTSPVGGPPSDLPLLGAGVARSAALVDSAEVLDAVRSFAASGVEEVLTAAASRWRDRTMVLRSRHRRTAELTRRAAAGQPPVSAAELEREAPIVFDAVRQRRLQPWIPALADLGVLPDPSGGGGNDEAPLVGRTEVDVALWPQERGAPEVRFRHRFPFGDGGPGAWPTSAVVPGSTVFAEAHRILVDGLDLDGAEIATGSAGRRVVHLDAVVARGPEESARDDGSAVARPPRPNVVVAAAESAPAWSLVAIPFGAQLLRRATLRASFGTPGTCATCGVVHGARTVDPAHPHSIHRIWCAARTDPSLQAWEQVELVSEQEVGTALRILLPVARLDVDRRVSAFEAVILAGIRRTGHDLHDLVAVHVPSPRDGGGVLHTLVLCSDSDAGREVLEWLADPGHFRDALEAGWRSGAAGAAASMVEDVLRTGGQPNRVDSLDGVSLEPVERQELAEAFVGTLTSWARSDDHAELVSGQGDAAFGLVVTLEQNRHEYQVEVQRAASAPRVVITTTTSKLPPVVVVPSGGDVGPDGAVSLGWELSWPDLDDFRAASRSGDSFEVAGLDLFDDGTRAAVDARQRAEDGVFDVAALEQNPVALLLDVLARPSVVEWRRVARAAVESAAGTATRGGRQRSAWSNVVRLGGL